MAKKYQHRQEASGAPQVVWANDWFAGGPRGAARFGAGGSARRGGSDRVP
jgi:hypothetical protein